MIHDTKCTTSALYKEGWSNLILELHWLIYDVSQVIYTQSVCLWALNQSIVRLKERFTFLVWSFSYNDEVNGGYNHPSCPHFLISVQVMRDTEVLVLRKTTFLKFSCRWRWLNFKMQFCSFMHAFFFFHSCTHYTLPSCIHAPLLLMSPIHTSPHTSSFPLFSCIIICSFF